MSHRLPGFLSLSCCALLAWGAVPAAEPRATAPTSDFSRGWFLVRLATPLQDAAPDKAPLTRTGRPALDALIAQARVQKIEPALAVSGRSPRFPEAFRRSGLDRTYRFFVPPGSDILSLVERFSRLPEVEVAEPDYVGQGSAVVPNDPLFPSQWGLDQVSDADVDAPEAWGLSVGSRTIIAVLDTGADLGHEDLAAKLLPGYDFVNNDAVPADDHGHGTNVASIASAVTDNTRGVAGSCWNCAVMPLKVLDAGNSGLYSWWTDAMVWATDHGAQVINLSAGGFGTSATLLAGVQYAYDAGVIHVSLTHNDNLHLVRYPGNYNEPITVGATDFLDHRAVPFCFSPTSGSNYGSRTDVVAPGNLILGAALGGGYNYWCGTSQAAPLVTGLVGIMESVNPSLGREEARHLLRSGADDQVGLPNEDTPGRDIYHGCGQLYGLLRLAGVPGRELVRIDPSTGACTDVGNTGDSFASIAFDGSGALYGLTGDGAAVPESLFGISTANAATTFLLTLGGGSPGEALGYDPEDGLLYRASGFGTQNVDEVLQKIHPAALGIIKVFLKGDDYTEAEALAFEGSGVFLMADYNTDLFRIVADGEDCLSCPADCNGIQQGNPVDFYCCGDGDGRVPVTCSDPRCTAAGNSCD